MRRVRVRRYTALFVAVGLFAAACDDGHSPQTSSTVTATDTWLAGAPRLFGLHLSEGTAQTGATATTPVVTGDTLSAQRLREILALLPEFVTGATLQQQFNWPTQTTPPPRAGRTLDIVFPPGETTPPDTVPTGALHVLRHQPDGAVPIAPYLSITFDQPMVPVTTVGQLDAAAVPVRLTPAVPGHWQWIGTRTLRFDATSDTVDRLPMATTFTVEVPTGTKSATGGVLAQAVTFTFTTPPPTVVSLSPQAESLPLDQVFIAAFDQRVDPATVLAAVHLQANGKDVPVRVATSAEIAADDTARMVSESTEAGRWVAFRATENLPTDAALIIAIGPGTPSAEGPATTATAATFHARTYAPLRIQETNCSSGDQCPPGSQIYVQFNNVLDVLHSDVGKVVVSPAIAGMQVSLQGSTMVIGGATLGRTTYDIKVPASFTDTYGQTLGRDTTVKVSIGSASPSIQQFQPITTLDPFATTQQLSVLTVNHNTLRVRVFAADPAKFAEYARYASARDAQGVQLPGWTVLSDATLSVKNTKDAAVVTDIDLSGVLHRQPGQVIVLVEPVPSVTPNSNDYWQNRPALTWVQATTFGVDVLADATRAYVWATDLRTGTPVQGVSVRYAASAAVTTDAQGQATLSLPTTVSDDGYGVVVAALGDQTAIIQVNAVRQTLRDQARWYVFDDRQVYQPGETMRVKGWVRRLTVSGAADLVSLRAGDTIDYIVTDAYGNQILKGTTKVRGLGGFDLSLAIPATADLGQAFLQLSLHGEAALDSADYSHQFQIQQYRRPEFEVITRAESEGPYVSTTPATLAATGTYYAGGPLASSSVDWLVTTTAATYAPPGWTDFTFGIWAPWWNVPDMREMATSGMVSDSMPCCGPTGESQVAQYHGTTDASGTHYLQLGFEGADGALPDLPVSVSAQATVTDVNRQAWSDTTAMLVHAADRYVGLRSTRTFVRQGDPLTVEAVVTGIDGGVQAGVAFDVVAGKVESKYVNGTWTEVVVDPQTCHVTSSSAPSSCNFDTAVGGQYKVTAVVAGSAGGHNRSELTTWVSGAESQPTRGVEQGVLTVVPDKATYAAGDTAELLVQAPFATGEGLLTVLRNGVRSTQRFTVVSGSAVVQVPVSEADVPQLTLGVEVVGATTRTADDGTALPDAPQRPAYAVGSLVLSVPPVSRTLTVTAVPRQTELAPGGSTAIDVKVTDAKGAPVQGAEFAVVVVDEAVLALSGYQLTDPLGLFYGATWDSLTTAFSRAQIALVDPATLDRSNVNIGGSVTTVVHGVNDELTSTTAPSAAPNESAGDSSGGGKGSTTNPVDVRSNFDALALFQPTVTTGADGTASVDLTLPDNLTRYRVMVVAVSGADRFGSAESNITARLPLAVRPSAPRFANYGDSFELPVVLQNQTNAAMSVDVVLETANLAPGAPLGTTVTVPANGRVEVRFPVTTVQAGTASFRVTAVSGEMSDSATVELPVYTPATSEAFATYGTVDSGAVDQPLVAPKGVIPQFGGLQVSTSSTSLQALTDAVLYIVQYPYESSDGRATRIMSIAALRKVLTAFDTQGMPTAAAIDAAVKADIAGLVAMQNDDGGFPWWRRGDTSEPFDSVQVAHALTVAKAEGYLVPRDLYDRVMNHIANIESYIPSTYGEHERDTISAYALWVRSLAGAGDTAKSEQLYRDRKADLSVDALAWLWTAVGNGAMKTEIARTISNRAVETAAAANFTTGYGDGSYLVMQSDRRTDGIVLDALIANDPRSDLIPKVVTGLLADKVRGRWDNVQENSFILLALKRYYDVFETQTPDFVARVWLGDRFAGEHTFQGRQTDRANLSIPMSDVVASGNSSLVVSKAGAGRLYYRIGLTYAPTDLMLSPLDRGFTVTRTYEAVDDPKDVTQDANGTWHIKAGARVRVKLSMVAESQRTHVALIDPLPAGLESLNPALAVTQTVPVDSPVSTDDMYWWWGQWYQHEQLRSDRTEAFTTLLPAGVYAYEYIARATTLGTFVVPPTRAEEMYAPETFGRSGTDKVVIG